MGYRGLYAFLGFVLGLSVPCVGLFYRAFHTNQKWWMVWFKKEWQQHDEMYIGVALIAAILTALIGYLIGHRRSEQLVGVEKVLDKNRELSHLATTDALTGLFNARYLHEQMDIEILNAQKSTLSCLLIDIDHFKNINDQYGHPFGDTVLMHLASVLKTGFRRLDIVGRLGGEEFLVLLPNTPIHRAMEVAERTRAKVEEQSVLFEREFVQITISIGVVSYPFTGISDKQSLLKAADEALYLAKNTGRNRIAVWKNIAKNKTNIIA